MKKTLLALGCAVLVLVFLLYKNKSDQNSMQAPALVFDTTQFEAVDLFKIMEKTDTAEVKKSGGQWLTVRDSFPGDTVKINKAVRTILGLQNKELVSVSKDRLAEYGMDTSQAKHIEMHGPGGKTYQIVIGRTSGTDYNSTYWKWEDKPEIYRTPGSFAWEFTGRLRDWKEHLLAKLTSKEIRSVEVRWHDSLGALFQYTLETVNDSTYRLVSPDSVSARKDFSQSIMTRVAELSADDFVAKSDTNLSKARLDSPMVAIKVNLMSGKSWTVNCGKIFDNFFYTQHPSHPTVIKLATWRMDPIKKKPFELAEVKVPDPVAKPK